MNRRAFLAALAGAPLSPKRVEQEALDTLHRIMDQWELQPLARSQANALAARFHPMGIAYHFVVTPRGGCWKMELPK